MAPLLVSFLYLCLHVAFIILIAYVIVWLFKIFGIGIDENVYKAGKVVVLLLIIIAVVIWVLGLDVGLLYRR